MGSHGSPRAKSGLPSWCKAMFVVNIIAVGFSVWRVIYNLVFLLAILKARTLVAESVSQQ